MAARWRNRRGRCASRSQVRFQHQPRQPPAAAAACGTRPPCLGLRAWRPDARRSATTENKRRGSEPVSGRQRTQSLSRLRSTNQAFIADAARRSASSRGRRARPARRHSSIRPSVRAAPGRCLRSTERTPLRTGQFAPASIADTWRHSRWAEHVLLRCVSRRGLAVTSLLGASVTRDQHARGIECVPIRCDDTRGGHTGAGCASIAATSVSSQRGSAMASSFRTARNSDGTRRQP